MDHSSATPRIVERILLGAEEDKRQLQDSPILGDVWLAYAHDPGGLQDLLITPHRETTGPRLAKEIRMRLLDKADKSAVTARVAYLQGLVAATLRFEDVVRVLTPMTQWWHERHAREQILEAFGDFDRLVRRASAILQSAVATDRFAATMPGRDFTSTERYLTLAGLILWAARRNPPARAAEAGEAADEEGPSGIASHAHGPVRQMMDLVWNIFTTDWNRWEGSRKELMVFQVSLNRPTLPALIKSVPAVKADAAKTLFKVVCKRINWAVIDSGIDREHDAFNVVDADGRRRTRIKATFDFTRIRDLLSPDVVGLAPEELAELIPAVGLPAAEVRRRVEAIAADAQEERPVNWDLVEELITQREHRLPSSPHGTHVAGIIGADAGRSEYGSGLCPDINLYDFRVLGRTLEDTEFAVIAALQYIRYLNEKHSYITVHGVNMSLSIPHNVRNYACGRTPVCIESERLVDNGVVVVAAAGNRGYQQFETRTGVYEGYAAFSITDPGNADGVITVGSTHGNWPHTYGVSFFSSRGPTGDGRVKPDLVAPGERIHAPFPGQEWREESGTSMAAPHVSGAAAMLLARYAELIGQPRRVKKILCETATDLGRERSFQGHGMLDVLRAFQSI